MAVKVLLFKFVLVTYIIFLQFTQGYCSMETIRSSGRGKIQPLFLNMSIHEETRVTTYYGRFVGPSDLKSDTKGTSIRKVSGGSNSEFEIIAKFPHDDIYRRFTLRSESTSETLKMNLNTVPANTVQTTFGGTRCEFEVKRLREKEIEEYSSSLKNCGRDADYDIFQYFGGNINKDGKVDISLNDLPESSIKDIGKYLNITFNYNVANTPGYHQSVITLNKLTMMEDNVQLDPLYFDVFALGLKPIGRQYVSEAIVWRFNII